MKKSRLVEFPPLNCTNLLKWQKILTHLLTYVGDHCGIVSGLGLVMTRYIEISIRFDSISIYRIESNRQKNIEFFDI